MVEYVKRLRRESPRDVVTVYIPEYVLGHWWEQVLHNQSALRLKTRLLQQRGVIVASVPYQLRSATSRPPRRPAGAGPSAPWPPGGPPQPEAGGAASRHAGGCAADRGPRGAAGRGAAGRDRPRSAATPIGDCADREVADVAGTLRTVTLRPRGASLTMEADLWDGTGSVTLIWLGRRDIPGIQPGRRLMVRGRITRIHGERTIYNPVYELPPARHGLTGRRSGSGQGWNR